MSDCNAPIFVGDEGTIFRLTVQECIDDTDTVVDVSGQTDMKFHFQRPHGTILSVTPVFTTDGINGEIQYVTVSGDINTAGVWTLQAVITLPSGDFATSIVTFDVDARIA